MAANAAVSIGSHVRGPKYICHEWRGLHGDRNFTDNRRLEEQKHRTVAHQGRRPFGVLFLTVTGAAPISAMLGNVPFAAGFGNGI